jgi:hypothetical protein
MIVPSGVVGHETARSPRRCLERIGQSKHRQVDATTPKRMKHSGAGREVTQKHPCAIVAFARCHRRIRARFRVIDRHRAR